MSGFRHPGRRGLREELEATWFVYDATRPIRKQDFDQAGECTAPAQAEPPQPSAQPPHGAEAETHGGTRTADAVELHTAHGIKRVTLTNPKEASVFVEATDKQLAALFGISEMEVREARKWARENTERLGVVTITGIDDGKVTLQ